MTIYVDVILIENLMMDYIILFATGIVLKIEIKHLRLILASLLGAVYTVLNYVFTIELFSSFLMKFVLSLVIIYIAFKPDTFKKLVKYILIFYLVSFVFGGASFALIYLIKPQEIILNNGLSLSTTSLNIILASAVIAFIIITTAFKIVKSKISEKDMYCEIRIKLNGKIVETKAMIDTGNFLKDPITGIPVIVVENNLLKDCIPSEILDNVEQILGGEFSNIDSSYISRLKVIPFSSLGKQNGMLLGIKAESVVIKNQDEEKIVEDVILGIYNKSLTKKGEYRALLGIELI